MKKLYLYSFSIFLFSFCTGNVFSQDNSPLQFGADLMSRYIWRGIDLGGESPSIQPSVKYIWSSKDTTHSITVGAWGAYNLNTFNQEADLYFSYTYKNMLSLTITDYYFPGTTSYTYSQKKYFNYYENSTGHVFEPSISFNGTDKCPFTILFAMNVFGADARKINEDGTIGNIFMSKYLEIGYKMNIKGVDFNAFIGATTEDPDEGKGELGFYGYNKSAGVVNLGIKTAKKIKITNDYSIPVQASVITNPECEKIYLVFGISL